VHHAAKAPLLRPHAHEQEPHVRPPARAQQCKRPQKVLMALLPDEPRDRDDEVIAVRRRVGPPRDGEALDVDAGRTDAYALGWRALEQERVARALGAGEEDVGRLQDGLAVGPRAYVAVGAQERQRLPHVHGEPEAKLPAQGRRLRCEPEAELSGVDNVGVAQMLLEAEVALAHGPRGKRARAAFRQPRPDRLHRHALEREGVRIEQVVPRNEHLNLVAGTELLPRPEVPRIHEVPADKNYSHGAIVHTVCTIRTR
jgi:hypothetical protein